MTMDLCLFPSYHLSRRNIELLNAKLLAAKVGSNRQNKAKQVRVRRPSSCNDYIRQEISRMFASISIISAPPVTMLTLRATKQLC